CADDVQTTRSIAANREILEARFAPVREAIEELRGLSAKRDRAQQDLASHEAELRPLRARPDAPASGEDLAMGLRARQEAMAASIRDLEALRGRLVLERDSGNAAGEPFEPIGFARLTG